MYQVTFIRDGALHVVTSPNRSTMLTLGASVAGSRVWQSLGCGAWALI